MPPWSTCTLIPRPGPRCSQPGGCGNAAAPDPDFGLLRVGTGAQRLATRLIAPQTGPVDGLEPVTALALRRFLRAHAMVPELPVALSLHGTAAIWLEAAPGAGPEPARALARALVAQYVLWHGPADALLAVVAARVPGAGVGVGQVAAARRAIRGCATPSGPLRMVTAEADDVRRWWEAELAGRAPGTGAAEPHLLVVVDDAAGPGSWAAVAGHDGAAGRGAAGPAADAGRGAPARRAERAVLDGRGRRAPVPSASRTRFPVARGRGAGPPARPLPARRCRSPAGAAAGRGPARAARPARGCARGHRGGVDALRVGRRRRRRTGCACRSASTSAGTPVALDLKESAQGGSGPHGLCIGATGSGQERAAAHPRGRPGRHPLAGGAEPRARRLQGRRHVPRPRAHAARLRR